MCFFGSFVIGIVTYAVFAFEVVCKWCFCEKNIIFSGISTVISRVFVKCSSPIVLLRRSGRARFFSLCPNYV